MNKIPTRRVSSPFFIGLFVISSTLIAIAIIVFLGASQLFKERTYYCTYFEGSVEGLDKGSPVKYLGVPAGSIRDIRIAEDGKLVEIIMQIDSKVEISDKLRVKSELSGFAGGRFLQLYYPESGEMLDKYPHLNFKPELPLILSAPSGLEEIEIAMKEVMNDMRHFEFGAISEDTKQFLQASTKLFSSDSIYVIMYNLKEATSRLNNLLAAADTSSIIKNLEMTSHNLLNTSQELSTFSENLNKELYAMDLPGKVANIIDIYDSTMSNTNLVISNVGIRSETLLFGLHKSLEEIKATNRLLRKAARDLTDSPGQLLLSKPPKEEK